MRCDSEVHVLLRLTRFASSSSEQEENLEKTLFTARDLADDAVTRRTKRPALLISSTSWTGEAGLASSVSLCWL